LVIAAPDVQKAESPAPFRATGLPGGGMSGLDQAPLPRAEVRSCFVMSPIAAATRPQVAFVE
jgi:hypothetical protein